jgi:prevent-host-death family protein
MASVNVTILKAKLSEKLSEVREGASFVVTDRRVPIARLVPIERTEDSLIERPAAGPFKPVPAAIGVEKDVDWQALFAAERGDR